MWPAVCVAHHNPPQVHTAAFKPVLGSKCSTLRGPARMYALTPCTSSDALCCVRACVRACARACWHPSSRGAPRHTQGSTWVRGAYHKVGNYLRSAAAVVSGSAAAKQAHAGYREAALRHAGAQPPRAPTGLR
jgi:hypothetical protein